MREETITVTVKEAESFLKEMRGTRMDIHFECALSNLFRNEKEAEILVSFLMKYKKYGSKREQDSIQDFLDGIEFYKERKIFFGEEE